MPAVKKAQLGISDSEFFLELVLKAFDIATCAAEKFLVVEVQESHPIVPHDSTVYMCYVASARLCRDYCDEARAARPEQKLLSKY